MKLYEVTKENMHLVSAEQVYEWVKTGKWSKVQFLIWVSAIKMDEV